MNTVLRGTIILCMILALGALATVDKHDEHLEQVPVKLEKA